MKQLFIKLILIGLLFNINTLSAKAEPLIGEVKLFSSNYCPRGWSRADGKLLKIVHYSAAFSVIGNTYGGDGRTNFALPDLRGRVPVGFGNGNGLSQRELGEKGGLELVMLTEAQIPSHSHDYSFVVKEGRGVKADATGSFLAESGIFRDEGNFKTLTRQLTKNTGSAQPHINIQPTLVSTFCVSLQGVYPGRN
ncbi:MAG: phage tail protein [Candidatus Caenarcaniphilales bacterium]|nr:phage tail protein [Candidatus Caenarcaniphilales bacterium]